jgi:mannose-6-phosphate isomerase-like protein (cupin superfamily)
MRIGGKNHSQRKSTPDGLRDFYALYNRPEGADQDVSFVLQINRPGFKSEEGNHDLEQWFFVHRGTVRFHIAGEETIAGPGDLVYVPREAMHCHEPVGDEPAELLVIDHWPQDSENQLGWDVG